MKGKNIFVFCAHSDDQIFGPGATLAKYAEKGYKIYTIIFSYGESSLVWLKRKIAVETRVKEAKRADKIINGKEVFFLGLNEGRFAKEIVERRIDERLKRMIKQKRPVKIFTHSADDPHPDHKAVYKIVTAIVDDLDYKCDVLAYDVWTVFNIRRSRFPVIYIDVTGTFNKKLKALKCFESQKSTMMALLWSVYFRALINGIYIGARYAERFFKVR